MKGKHVNANVSIVILPTVVRATYGAGESKKIRKTVMDELLLASHEPYHKVQVVAQQRRDGSPRALIAYMMRSYSYTADVVKLNVDASYKVRSINATYASDKEENVAGLDFPEVAAVVTGKRKPGPDMVFGTPVPEIATAKQGIEHACKVATAAGYKVVKLLGPKASVANYKKYLTGNLKAFGNIGHGYTGGIVLADGNLTASWFSGLAGGALKPAVVYFNSCQVFNAPLQPAIMGAGARTFVGGKINLLIGDSEEVFKCFWSKVLKGSGAMGPTLKSCESANYPTPGAHGISGDVGKFKKVTLAKRKKATAKKRKKSAKRKAVRA